jgi:hypothetical protein
MSVVLNHSSRIGTRPCGRVLSAGTDWPTLLGYACDHPVAPDHSLPSLFMIQVCADDSLSIAKTQTQNCIACRGALPFELPWPGPMGPSVRCIFFNFKKLNFNFSIEIQKLNKLTKGNVTLDTQLLQAAKDHSCGL